MAPVASWVATSGVTGSSIISPVSSWLSGSYDLVQTTAGNQPSHVTGHFTTGHAIDFERANNDYLSIANPFTTTLGSIAIVFRPYTIGFKQVLVAVANTAAANEWFEIGFTADGRLYIERNAAGAVSRVSGPSILTAFTNYQMFVAMDDTDYYMTLNGVEENPLVVESAGAYGWFGDVSSGDKLSVGGCLPSGSPVRSFDGEIGLISVWDTDITH